MSNKNHLTLYVDSDLVQLAKTSKLNLSKEFEDWIKIRLNQFENGDKTMTQEESDKLIAEHLAEISRLKANKEIIQEKEDKYKEEEEVITEIAKNINEVDVNKRGLSYNDAIEEHLNAVVYIFKKRFNKDIDTLQAKDLIIAKLNEINYSE